MNSKMCIYLWMICLILLISTGCDQGSDTSPGTPSGTVTSVDGCKNFNSSTGFRDPAQNEECVRYAYKQGNILTLEHLNAGFNCCPDSIATDIQFGDDWISIVEWENYETCAGCDCNCLYDLEIVLSGIVPGRYFMSVKCSLADPIEFWIDLNHEPFGTVCIERNRYPWAEG